MIAVIFEVEPRGEAERADYLDIAASLRSLVEEVDGFISVERFQSLTHPGRMLSLSFFRDEAAVGEWRRLVRHRAAALYNSPSPDNTPHKIDTGRADFASNSSGIKMSYSSNNCCMRCIANTRSDKDR